ncbi:hypothetical protein BD309DRAFT_989035 [Dichomitus squalens]|nr:hypothetical protein BD309DRAFT_989035 [Dichomitus squalens]
MKERSINLTPIPFSKYSGARMALLFWGIAWFAMSVVIFILGRIIPPLRSKPPPLVLKPRSPRIRSTSLSPATAPIEPSKLEEKDDVESTKSAPCDIRSSPPPVPLTSKRPSFRMRWSLSKSSRPPSPKSSAGSVASLTLVDNSSPSRYVPDLPSIEGESGMAANFDQDDTHSTDSPTGSPRLTRNVRLPTMKMLKSLSRKVSTKPRSASAPSPSVAPLGSTSPLEDDAREPVKQARRSQSRERPEPSVIAPESDIRPQQRTDSISGETFTTTFVNPFRLKHRNPKASITPTHPPSRRASGPRRMLNSLSLTLASKESRKTPIPDSPRSSISTSASTSTFSGSSVTSAFSASSGSPSVRRTQPYAAPYYAPMPVSSSVPTPLGGRSCSGSAPARRRAASCSPEWRPEPVEEESGEAEDANALGLDLAVGTQASREARAGLHGRQSGHRTAASESLVVLGPAGRR